MTQEGRAARKRALVGGACDTVKLREVPKAATTKPSPKGGGGRGNDLGYGNNVADVQWIIRSQVLRRELWMQFND